MVYKTPKNNIFHIIMIVIIPVLIGILAAIAIPAYQDYVERAKSAQISQQG